MSLLCLQKSVKEGLLLKQTSSFQRWKRRYFKLRGRTLYYAKDSKVGRPGGAALHWAGCMYGAEGMPATGAPSPAVPEGGGFAEFSLPFVASSKQHPVLCGVWHPV